jgi:DNA-binding GntR family transcriptional regulator
MPLSKPPVTLPRITTPSAADELADALRSAILRGELAPGDPLRELAIAAAAEVSRSTVREAITALVHDGLVVHQRHRGAVVREPSAADVDDVFRTRRVLELAAVDAFPGAPAERREALGGAAAAMSEAAAAAAGRDWAALTDRDLEFHAALVALLGSDRIDGFYRTVLNAVSLYFSILYRGNQEHEDPREIAREHTAIHERLVAGDGAGARRLLDELLETNRKLLLELI